MNTESKKTLINLLVEDDAYEKPPSLYEKLKEGKNKKIISFSLFGDKPLYFLGAEKNISEAKEIYPDYICRFYCSKDVPNLDKLKSLAEAGECELIVPDLPYPPVFWRILACDDPDIEICLQRDCDSVVNHREKAAVDEWLKSEKTLHFMHDCKAGHFHKIMAGMWGIKKNDKFNFTKELKIFFKSRNYKPYDPNEPSTSWGSGVATYFDDQYFLQDILYKKFEDDYLEHGEENPFPPHEPIKYGSFVGDRVLSTDVLNLNDFMSYDSIFIQSHLAIDDQMPLNSLIRHFHSLGKEIIFAVREVNFKLIKSCLSDLDNVHYQILVGNQDGIEFYLSYYDSSRVGFLCLGSGGKKIHSNETFIDKCYIQAGLDPDIQKSQSYIPEFSIESFTEKEIEILNKYKKIYNLESSAIESNKSKNNEDFHSMVKNEDGSINLDRILQRPASTHQFLIDGLIEFSEKYLKENSTMIEVGCYAGESTKVFLESGKIDKIYCIDPWQNDYDDTDESSYKAPMSYVESLFDKNTEAYKDKVVKLKMPAQEAFSLIEDLSADLVYLDGEHTYEANKKYLELYNPKLKDGGYMCGHDWNAFGQTKAIKEFFNQSDPIEVFKDNSWVYNKLNSAASTFNINKNKLKIAFHTNEIGVRGSEWASYKYAHYNEKILGNDSIYIAGPKSSQFERPESHKVFSERFKVYRYDNWSEVDNILLNEGVDIIYMHKGGNNDGKYSNVAKTCVHACFQMYDPHGDVYAYNSEWLSGIMNNGSNPFVPLMVDLPNNKSNLRQYLNIPNEAVVFGRLGGPDQFDINYVKEAVKKVLSEREDVYFLFGFTDPFISHPRVIHYPAFCDEDFKNQFINTCDAMIHARTMGESFGLAIAEFSSKNKPVITFNGGNDKAHLHMLGDKALYYNNYDEVYNILNNFTKDLSLRDWDAYSEKYNPNAVMKKFKEVFID